MNWLAIRWWVRRLWMRFDGRWRLDRKWTAWNGAPEADQRENKNIETYRSKDEWPRH